VFEREGADFNVLVDLCGVFKKTSIYEVRDLVLRHFGPDKFRYIYHISKADGSDRVLYLNSNTDVQYDQEFYKYLCQNYGADLRSKVFFLVDNRNVIGKDIPFQLGYLKRFGQPLFSRSVVLAHDVDDFSKIWQAMGRSRTMNETRFSIYKKDIPEEEMEAIEASRALVRVPSDEMEAHHRVGEPLWDIKKHPLTRRLYVKNCDRKIIGNLSSIYQTLVSLFNLSKSRFYHENEIVNVFLEKMEGTIGGNIQRHEARLSRAIFGARVPASILTHILEDKLHKSAELSATPLSPEVVQSVLSHIIYQKFEHREPSKDVFDELIRFLSGEQMSLMEISYTKQQQKQKQKQLQKNQDADTMEVFREEHQLLVSAKTDNYFQYTLAPNRDLIKVRLDLPIPVPILKMAYFRDGAFRHVNVYPTLQFLYSIHIQAEYISKAVKATLAEFDTAQEFCTRFLEATQRVATEDQDREHPPPRAELDAHVIIRQIRQNPQYTLAALRSVHTHHSLHEPHGTNTAEHRYNTD